MESFGRILLFLGLALAAIGVVLMFADRLPFLNQLGRLPGDINIRREGFQFSFPVVSCIVISIVLSILLNIFRK